jgi:secretory phospholipase A2
MCADDYLNMLCNQSLLDCVAAVRSPAARIRTFEGNQCNVTDVADEITSLVEAAVFAKRILHRP